MNVGAIFLIIAAVLFFLEGLGVKPIPGAAAFAHFCLCLGLVLFPYPWPWWRTPP